MKARGIVVIDYDIDGGFKEAAEEEQRLEEAISKIVKDNKRVVFHQVDMKERRGDVPPDIKKMKFRTTWFKTKTKKSSPDRKIGAFFESLSALLCHSIIK